MKNRTNGSHLSGKPVSRRDIPEVSGSISGAVDHSFLLVRIDRKGTILGCNPAFLIRTGIEDPESSIFSGFVSSNSRPVFQSILDNWLSGRASIHLELLTPALERIDVQGEFCPIDANSGLLSMIDTSTWRRDRDNHDIVFRRMFERNCLAMLMVSPRGEIIEANETAMDFWGYSISELRAMTLHELLPFDHTSVDELLNGATLGREHHRIYKARLRSNALRDIELHVSPLQVGDSLILSGVLNDITDKRELETDVLRHQRLESIGFLAGGIAHDFNNLLQIITGNLSLMGVVEKQEATPSHRDHLERIESAIERAKWITRQLLTFSEGGAPNLMPGQLPELVREVVDFTLGGSNVICEYNIQEDLPEIMLDDDQMRQAIQNLVLNARQAMPAGGKITIDIGPRHDASKHGKLFVELRITDTGEGIPSDNLSRVFDPYFTTREMARGLGLSIVFSIIRNHEGEILVESQPDLGTTFTLRFPAINATLPSVSNAPLEADAVFGSGRILYLEDDPMLIEVTEMMLTFLGYEMICVRDGAEAVEAYRERMHTDRAIDLLILDLTIPGGMGGIETLRRIRELNPSVIAILASGYATTGDTSEYESAGFAGTLSKPFYINEISQMLDRLLHAKK